MSRKMPNRSKKLVRNISNETASTSGIENYFSQSDTGNNLENQINDCVRYIIMKLDSNNYISKNELLKNVFGNKCRQFENVIVQVKNILRDIYGFNLVVSDKSLVSTKGYFISNALPFLNYSRNPDNDEINDQRKILLMLILTHIFMIGSAISDVSLYSFLKLFKIDPDKKDNLFGDVKDYINNILVKQKYLSIETDTISKKVLISWGIRAEAEISKHEILKFVCKMYPGRDPKIWTKQFQIATEQKFDNSRINSTNNQSMEIEN